MLKNVGFLHLQMLVARYKFFYAFAISIKLLIYICIRKHFNNNNKNKKLETRNQLKTGRLRKAIRVGKNQKINNMKKHLLLLCLVFVAITTYGQVSIPNGNFETWTSSTWDYPQNYSANSNSDNFFYYHLPANVTKTTDAHHGTYAVQLSTIAVGTDTAVGYFLNGNPNGSPSTWTGGMAYNQKPTGIRGYYKYNVATGDSATIIMAFSKLGVNIGSYMFQIGQVHSAYTLFNFTLTPALTQTPDSVLLGFVSSKISGAQQKPSGIPGSTLLIDSVSFTGVTSQPALMNGDFESWQTKTYNSPTNWYAQNSNGSGFNRTTDAKAGLYAIELTTYLGDNNGNPVARGGQVSTGYYPNNCNGSCNELGGFPFSNQIDTLAFWYKYVPLGNDSAEVNINFKKNGVNIWGTGRNLHAAPSYTLMEIPFNIGQTPDSVMIGIQSSSWRDSLLTFVGSDLKIDEIHFKTQPLTTNIFSLKNEKTISIFPNPANDKIQVQCLGISVQSLEIYNVLGEKVYATSTFKQQIVNEIDLSTFQKGIYFIKIYDGEKIHTKKIVKQ